MKKHNVFWWICGGWWWRPLKYFLKKDTITDTEQYKQNINIKVADKTQISECNDINSETWKQDVLTKLTLPKKNAIIPNINLTFPSELPNCQEIIHNKHNDPRMLVSFMKSIFYGKNNSFTVKDINEYLVSDFGSAVLVLDILEGKELIKEREPAYIMQKLYNVSELKTLCKQRQLSTSGNKSELIEKLLKNGYKLDKRKYRHKLYEITDFGQKLISEEEKDRDFAITNATNVIKKQDFQGAVNFYNNYDNKWGFVHISGKKHTIFANYDIAHTYFEYIANYPMKELKNSEEFKNNLKACMIAGLMRGNKNRDRIADRFHRICNEPICCPNILDMYKDDMEEDPNTLKRILESMQNNIETDAEYVLKYYISKIFYLSSHAN